MTERENEAVLAFKPPSLAWSRLWLAPARAWHRPFFMGLEHVDPSHPTMFVGNHTLYGIQDVPHILYELQRVHGIFPRTLADRGHFALPLWRDLLTTVGCVKGTRENCRGAHACRPASDGLSGRRHRDHKGHESSSRDTTKDSTTHETEHNSRG